MNNMVLSAGQTILIIFICAVCTQLERALPFLIFGGRPVPRVRQYLCG
jgi:branched-subunit amino acid transport protein AzlD